MYGQLGRWPGIIFSLPQESVVRWTMLIPSLRTKPHAVACILAASQLFSGESR